MAEIEPSDLLATQPLHRARCLRGTQVATVAKQGGDEAFSWVIDLGFKAGQWSEQSMQVEPLLGLGQQIQYVDGRHILLESCLQQSQLRWILLAVEPLDDQTVVADPYELVLGNAVVYQIGRAHV